MKRLIAIIFIVLITSLSVFAEQSFTDTDLNKYKRPGDKESTGPQKSFRPEKPTPSEKLDEVTEEYDQDYWCQKGNHHRNGIEHVKSRVKDAEKELSKARYSIRWWKNTKGPKYYRERLNEAKRDLADRETQYRQFIDRAYRKDIPA